MNTRAVIAGKNLTERMQLATFISDGEDNAMESQNCGDQINRLGKLFMDTGEAQTPDEAEHILEGYRLAICVGPKIAESPTMQASLLTAVNTGRRCFLGGVEVSGCLDVPLKVPWSRHITLGEAVIELQGRPVDILPPEIPRILIGDTPSFGEPPAFCVRTTFDGWCGGVLPVYDTQALAEKQEFTPSGVLSGALGVSEAFQFVRGNNAYAGRRAVGLSLWKPELSEAWLGCEVGPKLSVLPLKAWLIGLGHLGQAFLWTLGLLPYAHPNQVELVLQDVDELVTANDSTSLLTNSEMIGLRKTRAMADWCEALGNRTRIVERKFANNFSLEADEPLVALCGVDNSLARADLEAVGFKRVLEAGLGAGSKDYLCFQTHSFPSSRPARERWGKASINDNSIELLLQLPAYRTLAARGFDRCGLTQLAGRSVGTSFVGAVTSSLVIAQLLRITMGETLYEVIDGDLRTGRVQAIPNKKSMSPFNLGFTVV
jgi:hypothetical protein